MKIIYKNFGKDDAVYYLKYLCEIHGNSETIHHLKVEIQASQSVAESYARVYIYSQSSMTWNRLWSIPYPEMIVVTRELSGYSDEKEIRIALEKDCENLCKIAKLLC